MSLCVFDKERNDVNFFVGPKHFLPYPTKNPSLQIVVEPLEDRGGPSTPPTPLP